MTWKLSFWNNFEMWISKFEDKKSANNEGRLYRQDLAKSLTTGIVQMTVRNRNGKIWKKLEKSTVKTKQLASVRTGLFAERGLVETFKWFKSKYVNNHKYVNGHLVDDVTYLQLFEILLLIFRHIISKVATFFWTIELSKYECSNSLPINC